MQIVKKDIKLSLFTWYHCLCRKSKTFKRELLELRSNCSKVAGYKFNTKKSMDFTYTNKEQQEFENKNTQSTLAPKKA